jgi:hypothetical protein
MAMNLFVSDRLFKKSCVYAEIAEDEDEEEAGNMSVNMRM